MCSYKIYGFCDGHIDALCCCLRVHSVLLRNVCCFENCKLDSGGENNRIRGCGSSYQGEAM